ncbi:Diphthamide biosynthesis protein 1 [Phlyctochytrium planicorne]|nr:Diphthamide biosynthesis protein 1 [Phlyctochytrium planicorne]
MEETNPSTPSRTDAARKRFVGGARAKKLEEEKQGNGMMPSGSIEDVASIVKSSQPMKQPPRLANQIPDDILMNVEINKAIDMLPKNYNFEIHKTLWQIRKNNATNVALQFPEGLLMYSLAIADILETFGKVETVVMGDVTYGACCIDDYTAKALGCDFMVHYGHSCLIPVDVTSIKTMYVFVDIGIDVEHFVETVKYNFEPGRRMIVVATIQFVASLHAAKLELEKSFSIVVPQSKPLSPGEVLGCTSPDLSKLVEEVLAKMPSGGEVVKNDGDGDEEWEKEQPILIYLGDGRFHLESIMIANPALKAFRYDPYAKVMTREKYHHGSMRRMRKQAIEQAGRSTKYGLIVGTLGRQGSPKVYDFLRTQIHGKGMQSFTILLSEVTAGKLATFGDAVDVWVQTSCPRLSIDWGHTFGKPLLSPYEAAVALKQAPAEWMEDLDFEKDGDIVKGVRKVGTVYPMDFYAKDSLGPWTPNYAVPTEKNSKAKKGVA